IAMPASADHDGYIFCTAGSCPSGTAAGIATAVANNSIVGGTSVSSPVFAGIVALLNQSQKSSGMGFINGTLYSFAASNSSAFHDVPAGTYGTGPGNPSGNVVPCTKGTPNCTTGTMGFKTTTGYDEVTGLGSVDAHVFVSQWATSSGTPTVTVLTPVSESVDYQSTTPVAISATVTPTSGIGNPTGNVTFYNGTPATGTAIGTVALKGGVASLSYNASKLAYLNGNKGIYYITAKYAGGGGFASSTPASPVTLYVNYFTVAVTPATVSVSSPGQTGTANVSATLFGNLNGSGINYTCSGLPAGAACTFGTVAPSGSASLSIATTAAGLHWPSFNHQQRIFYAFLLPGLLGVVSLSTRRRALRALQLLMLVTLLTLVGVWVACGGSSGSGGGGGGGTPAGTYAVTVTGTSGTLTNKASVTLTVQ
ncbi:MAG TPA: Ig-like domain repeat protein, partial [Terriglobales bacterium]